MGKENVLYHVNIGSDSYLKKVLTIGKRSLFNGKVHFLRTDFEQETAHDPALRLFQRAQNFIATTKCSRYYE
jgi:hypothetical protein